MEEVQKSSGTISVMDEFMRFPKGLPYRKRIKNKGIPIRKNEIFFSKTKNKRRESAAKQHRRPIFSYVTAVNET